MKQDQSKALRDKEFNLENDFSSEIIPWINNQRLRVWVNVLWKNTTLTSKKYCFASISANQSILDSTDTILDINSFTTNDTWMSVTNWQITITKTWFYQVFSSQSWGNNSTWRRFNTILVNSVNNWRNVKQAITWTNYIQMNNMLYLTEWDIIKVELYQESGGALNVLSNNSTFLKVYEL